MMTNRFLRGFLLLLAVVTLCVSPSLAQGRGKGNPHKQKNKNQVRQDNRDRDQNQGRTQGPQQNRGEPVFRQSDRDMISAYFRDRTSGLPPGLAKRNGNLPPGLQKQLDRNGTLPPGLQKRLQPLPPELDRRLQPLPAYYRRGVIGPDVITLNTRTGVIVDIIRGVAVLAGR